MLTNSSKSMPAKASFTMPSKASIFSQWEAVIAAPVLPDTVTENGCGAFSSSGSVCLDFFTSIVRGSPPEKVKEMFKKAWVENKHLALQILMNLRDRDGKQEKQVSFDAFTALKEFAPKTYLKNLDGFIGVGCWKDALVLNSMSAHSLVPSPELQLMAAQLAEDYATVKGSASASASAAAPKVSVSLVGKWSPTEGCHYGAEARKIAALLGMSMKEYRMMNTTLRTNLDVLERHESLNTWDKIDFSHVPATAMRKQKKAFMKHLPEKFGGYLSAVMDGKAKMNSKGVQLHELVRHYMHHGGQDAAVDAQWKALIDRLATAGTFKNAVAVCDVSGSMSGVPMEVSIAFGIALAELSAPPFNGKMITFSEVPAWHRVVGATLGEKVRSVSSAHWGMSTNFIAVFEMLLAEAQVYRLAADQMIQKIFVFTDMQFNSASAGKYETAFSAIKAKYAAAGYALPQIIFWNLRDTHASFPVQKDTPGVAMMSGFSAEMLKLFLDQVEMTPYSMMVRAVSKYRVVVVDESAEVSSAPSLAAAASSSASVTFASSGASGGAGASSNSSASSSLPVTFASSGGGSSSVAASGGMLSDLKSEVAGIAAQLASLMSKLGK